MPRTVRKKSSSPKASIEGRAKLRARRRKRNPEDNTNEVEINELPMEDPKSETVDSPKVDNKRQSARRSINTKIDVANSEKMVEDSLKITNKVDVVPVKELVNSEVQSPKVSNKRNAHRPTIETATELAENEVEIVEEPVESKVDKTRRTARRSIKGAMELAKSEKNDTKTDQPKRVTRSVSRLSVQVETPKSNPIVAKKRVSRRLTISDVSGVFEMESETIDPMIIDQTLPASSGEEETKVEEVNTANDMKNTTYSPISPKIVNHTENQTTPKSANRSTRRSSRFFGNESLVVETDPIIETEVKSPKRSNSIRNETFSPKSPKFLMDIELPPLPDTPVEEIEIQIRRQTSTPYMNNIKSPKSKKTTRRLDDSIMLQQSTATPRSIIKKKIKDKIGVSPIEIENDKENEVKESFITTRKRRSVNESMDISLVNAKRSRVTFHPNTSVFRIENGGGNEESDKTAEGNDGSSESNVSIDLLNDLNEYPGIEPPKTPKTDEGDQVVILNETFTPEDNNLFRAVDSIKKKQSPKSRLSRKSTLTPGIQQLNISTTKKKKPVSTGKKNNSTYSVEKGSMVKEFKARKTPNFASIHKKNTARMESLVDNHERKQERARKLFEWNGTSNNETKNQTATEEPRILRTTNKSGNRFGFNVKAATADAAEVVTEVARVLRTTNKSLNRFGFNVKAVSDAAEVVTEEARVLGTTNKSVNRFGFNVKAASERKQRMKDIAMKKIHHSEQKIKKNIRECVKGVRSNRRFDLLMQSRHID